MIARRYFRRSIMGALPILAVAACTSSPAEAVSSAVPAPSAFLAQLRPRRSRPRQFEAVQLVTVSRDGKAFMAEVRLSVRPDRLDARGPGHARPTPHDGHWTDAGMTDERSPNLPASVSPSRDAGRSRGDLLARKTPCAGRSKGPARSLLVQDGQRIILLDNAGDHARDPGLAAGAPWTGRMSYRNVRAGYSVEVQSVEQP